MAAGTILAASLALLTTDNTDIFDGCETDVNGNEIRHDRHHHLRPTGPDSCFLLGHPRPRILIKQPPALITARVGSYYRGPYGKELVFQTVTLWDTKAS